MKGIAVGEWSTAAVISIIVGMLGMVAVASVSEPLLDVKVKAAEAANAVALNIDTMASVEAGKVEIPIDIDGRHEVRVSFEESSRKEGGWELERGWYVAVIITKDNQDVPGYSRIYSYPPGGNPALEIEEPVPGKVCVVKESGKKHPEIVTGRSSC